MVAETRRRRARAVTALLEGLSVCLCLSARPPAVTPPPPVVPRRPGRPEIAVRQSLSLSPRRSGFPTFKAFFFPPPLSSHGPDCHRHCLRFRYAARYPNPYLYPNQHSNATLVQKTFKTLLSALRRSLAWTKDLRTICTHKLKVCH